MSTVRDLLTLLEEVAPARLAADWDNVGLMVGRTGAPARKVALALDPTLSMIQAAVALEAQVLLTHHPLIFRPLKRLDLDDPIAAALALAARRDLAVVAGHTNLDAATAGVAQTLVHHLGFEDLGPLEPLAAPARLKLAVFVPVGYEGSLSQALFTVGAGVIGVYQGCSFGIRGQGTFRAGEESRPFVGRAGSLERVAETRLEFVMDWGHLPDAIRAIEQHHPYEEPAYDVYPLLPLERGEGFGRLGGLTSPVSFMELTRLVAGRLGLGVIRVVKPRGDDVSRVALMPGSGGSYIGMARTRGAQVLITGDVGHHQAREAEETGLGLIDAGHWATERPVIETLAARLAAAARDRRLEMEFVILAGEKDPWSYIEG